MSFKKTNTLLPSRSMNKLFIVCINIADAFVSPMDITVHLYSPYWVKNAIVSISSSTIWHYQYPL